MFFLVWRGNGILCALVPVAMMIPAAMLSDAVAGHHVAQSSIWIAMALLAASAVLWPLGKRWNGAPGRTLLDPQTGQQVVLRKQHSMYWLKMEYWAIVWAVLGIVELVVSLMPSHP